MYAGRVPERGFSTLARAWVSGEELGAEELRKAIEDYLNSVDEVTVDELNGAWEIVPHDSDFFFTLFQRLVGSLTDDQMKSVITIVRVLIGRPGIKPPAVPTAEISPLPMPSTDTDIPETPRQDLGRACSEERLAYSGHDSPPMPSSPVEVCRDTTRRGKNHTTRTRKNKPRARRNNTARPSKNKTPHLGENHNAEEDEYTDVDAISKCKLTRMEFQVHLMKTSDVSSFHG